MHLDRQHPVRLLVEQAATGGTLPTKGQLDELLDRTDLPDGMGLGAYRAKVTAAARAVQAAGQGGNHAEARRVAEHHVGLIADTMTAEQAAIATTHPAGTGEDLDATAARMFGGY